MPTESNTYALGLKNFLNTILLLKRHEFEEFLNHMKINGMMNNHLRCSNLKSSIKISLKIVHNI